MSLLPQNNAELLDEFLRAEADAPTEPSKTFRLDLNESRIGNLTDQIEALKQAITKAILTPRSRLRVYDDNYGCELWDLIGADVTTAYIDAEIPRMVRDAIIYDDRINSVPNVEITRECDAIFIIVEVDSVFGEVRTEVTI